MQIQEGKSTDGVAAGSAGSAADAAAAAAAAAADDAADDAAAAASSSSSDKTISIPLSFTTSRLICRAPRCGAAVAATDDDDDDNDNDVDDTHEWMAAIDESAEEFNRWFIWMQKPRTFESSRQYIETSQQIFQDRKEIRFFLFQLNKPKTLIGDITLFQRGESIIERHYEIGYWIRTSYSGHGFMIEAVNGVTQYALHYLNAVRIGIRCDAKNKKSAAVIERAIGYQYEGLLRQYLHDVHNQLADIRIYSRIRTAADDDDETIKVQVLATNTDKTSASQAAVAVTSLSSLPIVSPSSSSSSISNSSSSSISNSSSSSSSSSSPPASLNIAVASFTTTTTTSTTTSSTAAPVVTFPAADSLPCPTSLTTSRLLLRFPDHSSETSLERDTSQWLSAVKDSLADLWPYLFHIRRVEMSMKGAHGFMQIMQKQREERSSFRYLIFKKRKNENQPATVSSDVASVASSSSSTIGATIGDLSSGDYEFVGQIGLVRINWSMKRFELAYWLSSRHTGSGLMTEAVRAVTQLAEDYFQANRIEIRCHSLNTKSAHVAERAGFKFEAELRKSQHDPEGKFADMRTYSRVRGVEFGVNVANAATTS